MPPRRDPRDPKKHRRRRRTASATYRAKRSPDRRRSRSAPSPSFPGGCSSCTSTPRGISTSICGWRWTACSGRGRCRRARRTTWPTSGSPCSVEDHPIEYGDFEGIIPKGNYGAGGIIVWDRGEWVPLEDWREGLEKGKLLFELKGYKLHGKWTLVKIKKSEKEWLLIKERDAYVKSPGDEFAESRCSPASPSRRSRPASVRARKLRAAVEAAGAARVARRSADGEGHARRDRRTTRSRATAGCSSSSSTAIA